MKELLIIIIFGCWINSVSGQNEKTIEQHGGLIYYGDYTQEIKSEKVLPENIQTNLKGYLNKILPSIIDSITFSHGQIIDLNKKFREEPITYNYPRIIPKYELDFRLKNRSIGIGNYNLEINIDEYGQILHTNWPKEILMMNNFKSLSEVITVALNQVKLKKIDYNSYEVDLDYRKDVDKLFWVIRFSIKTAESNKIYVIEFPWNSTKILDEYDAKASKISY